MNSFAGVSDAVLADQILTWAGRIAAGEARLVELIGEFDRREAWSGVGMLSCAQWLSLHAGSSLKAAYERVRVARALPELPVTSAAFAAGKLSWTQVRAITRVANAQDEQTWVDLARHASGAQLERLVRGVRRAHKIEEDAADPELAAHRMRSKISYDADGSLVLTVRLPADQGAVLLAAIEQSRAVLDQQAQPAHPPAGGPPSAEHTGDSSAEEYADHRGADRPAPATVAEGIMHLVCSFLQATAAAQPTLARRNRFRLVAQIDPLSGWARLADGEFLPPTAVPPDLRPAINPDRLRRFTAADLADHDLGRSAREPSLALRELLGSIDGERCRFPGCSRRRRLHAHHVVYWAHGGSTDLANLVLVCSRHHTLIHGQNFQLTLRPDRRLTVETADGIRVLHHPDPPWQPADDLDQLRSITPTTLPPAATDRLHLAYAVSVLVQQAA